MARSGTAERHQAAQAGVAAEVVAPVGVAWVKLLDLHDLKGSTPRLVAAIQAILHKYGRASAAGALIYYRNERRAADVAGKTPRLPMPPLPTVEDITATVEHVLSPLYGKPAPEAVVAAQDALVSEVEQMVLDQSRLAIIGAAEVDKEAKGWARVTEPGACSFCLMLATRGDVYTSKASADFRAHTKQPNGSGGTCRCHAEPVFNAYEPTAEIRKWQKVWEDQIAGKFSGRDARVAFRQAVEGRPVTGPLTKPYKHGVGSAGERVDTSSLGFDNLDRGQLEHQLTVLDGMKDSDYKRAQIARIRKRLAQLDK